MEKVNRLQDVSGASAIRRRDGYLIPPKPVEWNIDVGRRLDGREKQDRPAPVDRSEPLGDRLRRARAADDEVCEVPLVRLPRSGRVILPSVNHEVGARLPRRGFPDLHDGGLDVRGGPGWLRALA